jgi:hypothetical protein
MVPANSRRIPRAPRYSGAQWAASVFAYRALTLSGGPFQTLPLNVRVPCPASYNPRHALPRNGFGLLPVRSPLLGESLICFLFLLVLRCFSSQGWLRTRCGGCPSDIRVVPFGDPRIKGYLHLPADFRSLSRPSSPERA